MAQDIALRWRLATLEEAKEVVVCWNAGKSERNPERRGALLKSA
jgi:2,3-bisphosphoglycerate-independent phosphoglycerate mutase